MTPVRGRATGSSRTVRVLVSLCLGLGTSGLVAACGGDDGDALGSREQLRQAAQEVLDQRARALRTGDLQGFLDTVDHGDEKLLAREKRYFHNLQQLPLAALDYEVLERTWSDLLVDPDWGPDAYVPQVTLTQQLAGYDDTPVERLAGYAFAKRDGRLVVVGDRARNGGFFPGTQPAPWDIVTIKVRETRSVLGVYDATSWPDAAVVNEAVEDGIDQVQAALPVSWPGRVVVYEFGRRSVLETFQNVPGGNINHLGAMTFAVAAEPEGGQAASSRFVVMPGSVEAGQPFLGRITRHELTHVALGERDDGVPTWFAEGVAEYVGAREVAPSQRRIATEAVARARAGVDGLPRSSGFNGADQEWHYALAWMACDWIADAHGEDALWELMDALHADGKGTPDGRQDAVLRRVIGTDSRGLAQRAADRILRIYG